MVLQWPQFPVHLAEARSRYFKTLATTSESATKLTLTLEKFVVRFSWTEEGELQTRNYLVSAEKFSLDGKSTPVTIQYSGEASGEAIVTGTEIVLPEVPLLKKAKVELEVYARGEDSNPILTGSATAPEVIAGGVVTIVVPVQFTETIDRDGDGYIPSTIGGLDCDDNAALISPVAKEICDGLDTSCNGFQDETDVCLWNGSPAGIPMQTIPAGKYYVGAKGNTDLPLAKITLAAFALDRYEVSVAEFAKCSSCGAPGATTVSTSVNYFTSFPSAAMVNITWQQAYDYCVVHRNMRLPTEFEWEAAARGLYPSQRSFPWQSDSAPLLGVGAEGKANLLGLDVPYPVSVQAFDEGASPFGVYNMTGNAEEWTASWFESGRYLGLDPNSRTPPEEPGSFGTNPEKVVKGGSWASPHVKSHLYLRTSRAVTEFTDETGFRCASSLP